MVAAAYVARLPGFYDFDDLVDQGLPDWVSTISVLRGIELDEYTNRRWLSRPHSASGASREIGDDRGMVPLRQMTRAGDASPSFHRRYFVVPPVESSVTPASERGRRSSR